MVIRSSDMLIVGPRLTLSTEIVVMLFVLTTHSNSLEFTTCLPPLKLDGI